MAQATISGTQPNQNPNQPLTAPTTPPQFPSFSLLQPQIYLEQYYTATTATTTSTATPPGIQSYTSISTYPHSLPSSYGLPDASGYYLDPNSHNWAANSVIQQYGSDPAAYGGAVEATLPPNGAEQLTVAYPVSTSKTNLALQPNGTWKKLQKKTKVVQSAYCEICKVECNSKEVLDKHKLGKKHKKNLEKVQHVSTSSLNTMAGLSKPVIGPQENSCIMQRSKKKAEPVKDLETKRRKIVEGGAAEKAVRMCEICNVVCNSEIVFNYHLSGQKHAAMLKRHPAAIRVATAT